MDTPINERTSISSHTRTEHGLYDDEPFPTEGNAYYWYTRAVYWKRQAHRSEGVQEVLDFEGKSKTVAGVITLSPKDLAIVKAFLVPTSDNPFAQKIAAIKHVREVAGCGLVQAKDFVDAL